MLIKIIPIIATSTILFANTTLYVGKTYDFAEADMIEAIQSHIQNNGSSIEKKYKAMQEEGQKRIDNMTPKATKQLPMARETREFYANTVFTNPDDIKDEKGKVLYRKGYSYDPMDYINLPYSIVLVNANNKKEIEWLKNSGMLNTPAYRILITEGKYKETVEALGQHIFFATDQIITRLNIQATPSIASQEKNKLKIKEVCLVDCKE